jgi:AraC-like DNA-binding protein
MAVAVWMLRENGDSLNVIADHTDYTSEFASAKAFKRHFGAPPGACRREQRSTTVAARRLGKIQFPPNHRHC